ncbi:DUF3048 domain-containing protein [Leptolinea tardivitalis]|uniref:DUF3048 domain-containing protein n=1 Tax=Leptolinea tardivitalis TaxID=229920 RepID=A0A0P6WR90_9CHLR|nr:DUF3048 domain-containing protein [Leptolinea tardivitalis]KPL72593.1 hypothetical protein ADM99_05645 [Leptolinea tardivitalis]GAP21095.1 hypothetical protein LTAR_01301 [Leptolinea tardivitalis]
MKNKRIFLVVFFLSLLVSCQAINTPLPAASESQPIASTTAMPSDPSATIIVPDVTLTVEPTTVPENINPLTGLPVDDPAKLNRLPVLIKVSNYPRTGRPHAGLSAADIVFDYYIGEMFNRFLPVFYGNDAPQVGPIRSGRLVDSEITQMFRGILVYGNADERVDTVLDKQLGARAIPYKYSLCPPICGDDTHSVTGVFADSAGVTQYAQSLGIAQEKPGLQFATFSAEPPPGGQTAIQLLIQYADINRGEWQYDTTSGKYLRWIEDGNEGEPLTMIPLVDRNTGAQLGFSNVIILTTFYIEYNRTLHNIDLWNNAGPQNAMYFRDGMKYDGKWRISDHSQPLELLQNDGSPMPLKPGNTWIVLAGISSQIANPQGGRYELYFYTP